MAPPPPSPAGPPEGTTARALALRFAPDSRVNAGTALNLSVVASASDARRRLVAAEPLASAATALGLGVGQSALLAPHDPEGFFASPGLTLFSGGGLVQGATSATAAALGSRMASARATAINVAIAATDLLAQTGAPLRIGSAADPFAASARASSRSLSGAVDPLAAPATAQLTAEALVRGLEGTASGNSSDRPLFRGQAAAVVQAQAQLDPEAGVSLLADSGARAEAIGIEGYRVQVLAAPAAGAAPALVNADARARLIAPTGSSQESSLRGTAVGIGDSTILGPVRGALELTGRGVAELKGPATAADLSLRGVGLSGVTLLAGGGPVTVVGEGEVAAPAAAFALGSDPDQAHLDAAGIDASMIVTGAGNDRVEGWSRIRGIGGDAVSTDAGITDAGITDAGIRASTVSTGAGSDTVVGTASGSRFDTGSGADTINLQRARDSLLVGGAGADSIRLGAGSIGNQLLGGLGDDRLSVEAGTGNRLDGGFGQDLLQSSGTANTLVQSSAGAALRAATSLDLARQLADPLFWNGLSDSVRHWIWQDLPTAGTDPQPPPPIDAITGFDPGRDQLELSSSLAGLTQELWMKEGGLYAAHDGSLSLLEGDGSRGIGVVVGTLADIHDLGIGSPSIAYATDTRQLMFDADGDWSAGSQSIASLSLAPGAGPLSKQSIRFNA